MPAYSTLALRRLARRDPLLNTFINYPEGELARLIFHELAHQVVYAPATPVQRVVRHGGRAHRRSSAGSTAQATPQARASTRASTRGARLPRADAANRDKLLALYQSHGRDADKRAAQGGR